MITWPFDPEEVALEWRAQIVALRSAGVELNHLDTHHHVHCQHSSLLKVYLELARESNVPARTIPSLHKSLRWAGVQSADHCETGFYSDDPSVGSLSSAIIHGKTLTRTGGLIEVVCHPGYVTADLATADTYVSQRGKELEILTDPDLLKRLAKLSIEVVEQE